jgi:hypothetical protein
MDSGGTLRRAALGLVTAALLAAGSVVVGAASAQADEGQADEVQAESGLARYVVSDDGRPVQVEQVVVVTNQKPPTATRSFYRTRYSLWLPDGGSNVTATSGGSSLPVSVTEHEGEQFADISFRSRLAYGQSRTIRVTYAIKGAPPRSKARGRVGKGYAAFDVYSPGDAGRAVIEVVAPRSMETDLGLPTEHSDDGDTRTTVAKGGGPFGLWGGASLRDPSLAAKSTVTVGSDSFEVVAFAGDTAWAHHIATRLPATIRALEKVAGQKWPSQQTTITEDLSGEVYGWAGSYDKGDIRVSEDLDPALLAHELSHAFASYDNLAERWLTEGLAQEMATEISAATKVPDRPHPSVRPGQDGAFPLADWPAGFGVATRAEAYGYPASWRAVHALVDGSRPASRPALVRALTTKATVYDAPGEVTIAASPTTWRQAYDLFEVVGGNRQTRSIMTAWVIEPKDAKAISARATARAAYAAQDRLDGEWSLPRGVRTPMADWDFAAATTAMAQVRDLAAPALKVQQAAAKGGLDTKALRSAYQVADEPYEYQQVAAQLGAFLGASRSYESVESQLERAGPLTRLGATFVPAHDDVAAAKSSIEDLQFADAETALASARSRVGTATLVGTAVVGATLLVLLLVVLGVALSWRRHVRRRRVSTQESTHDAAWSTIST